MKLTSRQKNIAIFVGIGAITIGYLIWKRKKNEAEANALLEAIGVSLSQVDKNEASAQAIQQIQAMNVDPKKLKVDNLVGHSPKMRDAIANITTELWASMKGGGTSLNKFSEQFKRIKNKNTLSYIDKIYKAQHKEGLFEAMKGEFALANSGYAMFSDKTKYDLIIPFFSEVKWHPNLANYFNSLPLY